MTPNGHALIVLCRMQARVQYAQSVTNLNKSDLQLPVFQ